MEKTICGADCTQCSLQDTCAGCVSTDGRPFGGDCPLAACCRDTGCGRCESCTQLPCGLRERMIARSRRPRRAAKSIFYGLFIEKVLYFPEKFAILSTICVIWGGRAFCSAAQPYAVGFPAWRISRFPALQAP